MDLYFSGHGVSRGDLEDHFPVFLLNIIEIASQNIQSSKCKLHFSH